MCFGAQPPSRVHRTAQKRELTPFFVLDYITHMPQFITMDMVLRVRGNKAATFSLQPAADFLHQSTEAGHLANAILVLESDSSLVTGGILYGTRNEEQVFAMLPGLLEVFVGPDFFREMAKASTEAREADAPAQQRRFPEDASCHGRWRGLFLIAKGPTVHVPARKDEAVKLIKG